MVKPATKPANERYHSFFVNGTSDRLKITYKVLKIDHRLPKNRFQRQRINVFARILAKVLSVN